MGRFRVKLGQILKKGESQWVPTVYKDITGSTDYRIQNYVVTRVLSVPISGTTYGGTPKLSAPTHWDASNGG